MLSEHASVVAVLFFSSEFSENDTILHPFVEICM
jgi:hypothetical protein